ncbi:hypothetical protein QTP70_009411 [Hemibagrus guttatus]|uniref:Uncharacterized protein n=1 Tax=Hemibagrus guttatus TaxID=175788 RepID=A0AAE0Q9N7_9TELE|nr:hypothetical protein QTP70_009411 [Hemibagrus guttatus]
MVKNKRKAKKRKKKEKKRNEKKRVKKSMDEKKRKRREEKRIKEERSRQEKRKEKKRKEKKRKRGGEQRREEKKEKKRVKKSMEEKNRTRREEKRREEKRREKNDTMASARISVCLVDISSWMMAHQLKLNPSKTELLVIPGLPLNAIRPLQMIQNAAAQLVFNLHKFSHTTPLLRSLHWFLVAARIRFKTLTLAYKAKNGPAPSYVKALITPRTAPRSLRSTSTARLVPPSLREKGYEE